MSFKPYYLAIQRNTSQFVATSAEVLIPVWASESFPDVQTAADAISQFCGHDAETIERCDFVLIEISPPPET